MKGLLIKTIVIAIGLSPALMRASVIFSNVSGFNGGGGANICGSDWGCADGYTQGLQFTAGITATMTDAQALVRQNLGDPTFDVYLYNDSGGAPGSLIEQIGFAVTAPGTAALVTANSIGTPITLVSGSQYWLFLEPHLSNSWIAWIAGGTSSPAWSVSFDGRQTFQPSGTNSFQFQIDGTPIGGVPEPSTFALVVGALIACAGLKRWRTAVKAAA